MAKTAYTDVKFKESDGNYGWTKLFELFEPNTKILDIGCSSGNFGHELIKQKNCTVVGVDINVDDLRIASGKLSKTVQRNIETDNLSDLGKFDYVLMADVIEHLVKPVSALRKVKNLLLPGGRFIFSVPNMANIANRIELLGGRFKYTKYGLLDETHIHYYDRMELERVLAIAGFEVKKYNNTIRDVPGAVIKSELKRLGLTANDKFLQMANDMDSVTFQFIGLAEPAPGPARHAKLTTHVPHDFLSREFDGLVGIKNTQLKRIEELKAILKKEGIENKRLNKEIKRLDAELGKIYNSKGWKYLSKLRNAKAKLGRPTRRK